MSFDRRWLFTAAGAAFLSSLFRKAEGAAAAPVKGPAPMGAKTKDQFFALYQKGWPRKLTAAEEAVARKVLWDSYEKRFDKRINGLSDTEKAHLEGFAQTLGTLTYASLENNRKGTCGWEHDPNPNAKLGPEHVQAARELLGFYLNARLPVDKRCGPTALRVFQADEPCPLCPMP